MNIGHLLFSTEGRINRKQWWFGQLLAIVIGSVLSSIFHISIPHHVSFFKVFSLHNITIGALIGVIYFWIHLALNMKRWHDINKSGLWVILNYIPVIGFFVSLVVCGIVRGVEGDHYGGNPAE